MSGIRSWFIVIILVALVAIMTLGVQKNGPAPEIEEIKSLKTTQEQGEILKKLLDRVGPMEAQEEMLKSGLPFTGETHLLIHVIGDYIYDNYGPEGLPMCRDYFLSACYHAVILNTLADYGLQGVVDTMTRCNAARPGVAAQCAHGAGHGFVAWHDYNLIKALLMCDELGTKVEGFAHFNCYDGVFMENVWGVHDGKPSEKRWVKPDEIYYPCTDERIPEKYLKGCWSNQATLMYQYFEGNLRKTAEACDGVPDESYRDTCYDNLSRQIHPLTQGKIDKVFSLCANTTGKDRQESCILVNMSAYWSVGDRVIPFEICTNTEEPLRSRCFERIVSLINFHYSSMPNEKTVYCDKISSEIYQNKCRN